MRLRLDPAALDELEQAVRQFALRRFRYLVITAVVRDETLSRPRTPYVVSTAA